VRVSRRLTTWIFCASIVAVLPVVGPASAVAAGTPIAGTHTAPASHVRPFLPEPARARAASREAHGLKPAKSSGLTRHSMGKAEAVADARPRATTSAAPQIVSTQTDTLAAFPGASQANDIAAHGADTQDVAPPDTDIAAGPTDIVDTVNSTIEVRSRAGAVLGSDDLNTFFSVDSDHSSTDPRIVYDSWAQRWFLTITEGAPFDCSNFAAPVLIAVSASSNPLPFTSWIVYELPFVTPGTFLGDQPGLGYSTNTVAVSWTDYDCNGNWLGADVDIIQRTDLELDITGPHSDVPFQDPGGFAPQPVQSFGPTTTQYVVDNDSDCAPTVCTTPPPEIEVDAFTGTPEPASDVVVNSTFPAMTPTLVDPTYFGTPPAQQMGTSTTINTDDDRFLNAVWQNGEIWTADGTECTPAGDSAPRSCLDYVGVTASSTGVVNPTVTQINNVGVDGSYLFYPAVSVDSTGDVFTVFDESSSTMFPTIMSATIPSGGSTLSAFQTVHTSSGFYNPDFACQSIASTNACRWGDYSGAAQDPSNQKDVWVASEDEDGSTSSACDPVEANQCWTSDIADLTLAPPTLSALNPASGPVAGGQTVTVSGFDFGTDTTATFGGSSVTPLHVTATSFQFVTPPSGSLAGGTAQVLATDALGTTAALTYTYVGLANYVPVTPFRLLDTRDTGAGGPIGPGVSRPVQVTGVGSVPVPANATAAVLNVTEVSGSAASLLALYPYGTPRPNAANLNFGAHTVIGNLVTVTLGSNSAQGWVEIYNALGSVNVVVDVEGYFTPQPASDFEGEFHPITPFRVCDTRKPSTCDGHSTLQSGQSVVVTVAGASGIPGDGTAEAAVVNVIGVAGSASTYLSLFPTNPDGTCTPTGTSTINLAAGAVQANRVMVKLGPTTLGGFDDAVCVFNSAGTINAVVDANGWYGSSTATGTPTGYQYQALAPTRICDTRIITTTCSEGAIGKGVSRMTQVAGEVDIPSAGGPTTVVAVIANVTAITPTVTTFVTLYPANLVTPPLASDININAGEVLPNLVVVALDTVSADPNQGGVFVYNSVGSVNVTIDIEGWFQ
jgi:hypothetical protein